MTDLKFDIDNHTKVRKEFVWGSYGKHGHDDRTDLMLCDITDSHLLHIVGHVINHNDKFTVGTFSTILNEAQYRDMKRIFVPPISD